MITRTAPFLLAGLLGVVVVSVINAHKLGAGEVVLLAGGLALLTVMLIALPWDRLPAHVHLVIPLLGIVLISLAGDFLGGLSSGLSFLLLLPIAWAALYGDVAEAAIVIAASSLALLIPVFAAPYPVEELGHAVALLIVAVVLVALIRRGEHTARVDTLTGLANRRAWEEALQQELLRSAKTGQPVTVVLIDIDHFKAFNDAYGHPAGDVLLRDAAGAWTQSLRPGDRIARIGGEEFAVLLPRTPEGAAIAVADRLRRAMPGGLSCSCGLASAVANDDPQSIMRRADDALYRAKGDGRSRSVLVRTQAQRVGRHGAEPWAGRAG